MCKNIVDTIIGGCFLGVDDSAPEDILEGAYAYIWVIFLGIPVIYLYNTLSGIIRALAGMVLVPAFGFVGACFGSPIAWILADAFLIPAYFHVIKKLRKNFVTQAA